MFQVKCYCQLCVLGVGKTVGRISETVWAVGSTIAALCQGITLTDTASKKCEMGIGSAFLWNDDTSITMQHRNTHTQNHINKHAKYEKIYVECCRTCSHSSTQLQAHQTASKYTSFSLHFFGSHQKLNPQRTDINKIKLNLFLNMTWLNTISESLVITTWSRSEWFSSFNNSNSFQRNAIYKFQYITRFQPENTIYVGNTEKWTIWSWGQHLCKFL